MYFPTKQKTKGVQRLMSYNSKILVYAMRVSDKGEIYRGYVTEIDNTLKAKQAFVGGTIQYVPLTPEIDLIVDDEGKLKGYPMNKAWIYEEDIHDFIVGNVFCCRHDDEGNFTSIRYSDIPIIKQYLVTTIRVQGCYIPVPEELLNPYINLDELRRVFYKGRKLRLTEDIADEYSPKKAGDIFTVSHVDDKANIHGSWASGGSISIIYDVDSFEILE